MKLYGFIELVITPRTLFFPLPLIPLLVFLLSQSVSHSGILGFLRILILSSFFSAGVNLWNHSNDLEEDITAGRRNLLTLNPNLRSKTMLIAFVFYAVSILLAIIWSLDFFGPVLFIIVAILTWIYSDKFFLGRFVKRFKENYKTELITYSVSFPLFILVLWNLSAEINLTALALAIVFLFFGLWNVSLKDIKDITSDEISGIETLAVKFNPEFLFKISLVLICLYYFSIIFFSVVGIFPRGGIVCFILFFSVFYVVVTAYNQNWRLNQQIIKPLKFLSFSNIVSIILLSVSAIFNFIF
ncbi:MAG: UbiA family prenyltransferase [Archaeoglobus sp.]|nr:UbiA family prenyltransferase [Archaeoglobus sp.]